MTETVVHDEPIPRLKRWDTHIRRFAFFYVLGCYALFAATQLYWDWVPMDDPYGMAMVVLGLFWLGVMRLTTYLTRRRYGR